MSTVQTIGRGLGGAGEHALDGLEPCLGSASDEFETPWVSKSAKLAGAAGAVQAPHSGPEPGQVSMNAALPGSRENEGDCTMEIGDWQATKAVNGCYRAIRELGLESNIAELDTFGFTVIPPEKAAPPEIGRASCRERV